MSSEKIAVSRSNLFYLEDLYKKYLDNPSLVTSDWASYFKKLESSENGISADQAREHMLNYAKSGNYKFTQLHNTQQKNEHFTHSDPVQSLSDAYRRLGHTNAKIDPLSLTTQDKTTSLNLESHGLTSNDKNKKFLSDINYFKNKAATLGEIQQVLEQIYCHHIGVEYSHLTDGIKRNWIKQYLEKQPGLPDFHAHEQQEILKQLTAAEGLEKYIHTTFPGAKRFSLEGGESFIPLLYTLMQSSTKYGIKDFILGMAHRGRLNALVNIFGKLPKDLFDEFAGKKTADYGSGDVKYHHGYSAIAQTTDGKLNITMLCNPSHLAIVSPVVQGVARSKQDHAQDEQGNTSLPVVVHGDAAFTAQGVIMETLQLSKTRGYGTKGCIHIVINNQIGFTTHEKIDVRSTQHCTDVAKMVNAPIFHVNGDDPQAVCFITKLALDYRMEFKEDIVIDLVCYRRLGHNEADDPTITQPKMYRKIKSLPSVRKMYAENLIKQGVLTSEQEKQYQASYRKFLQDGSQPIEHVITSAKQKKHKKQQINHLQPADVANISKQLNKLPKNFVVQKQVNKIIESRTKMLAGTIPLDWGCAEILAHASLLKDGINIRLTGQDVARGTFAHRHIAVFDLETGHQFMPLANLTSNKWQLNVYNSLLSEEAVLAFEYGYTTTDKHSLVIWEAQFGDFANVAQVVIDQFISSGQTKWNQSSNLVMLLPHGYEGQGPEHSSARLERFLQLCGENNMQVCMPTRSVQIFNLLRQQATNTHSKPLIIMSPKSLLRHKGANCDIKEFYNTKFQTIINDKHPHPNKVTKVILSIGKIYYELADKIDQHTTIIRVEQLYPFPLAEILAQLELYPKLKTIVWCQDEPKNQGGWSFARQYLDQILTIYNKVTLTYAGRDLAAAPATGFMSKHLQEQASLISQAIT